MKPQKHTKALPSIFAVLLFTIYLSADLINSLHSVFQHQKIIEEVCSVEQEDDACHIAIYHGGESSCEHEEHFIPKIVDCELCSIILHRHTLPKTELVLLHHVESVSFVPVLVFAAPAKEYHYSYLLRGPPVYS